jgi:CheY-specific phosphatase CheX
MSRCASEFATIDQLLLRATVGLFHAMGIELTEVVDEHVRAPRAAIASMIGFSGDGLRGGLTLVLEHATVAALYPELDLTQIEATRDACGELSNMLVGQLKMQLRLVGVSVHLALPVTLAGEGMQIFQPWSGMSSWQVFRGPPGLIRTRLDVRFAAAFAFGTPPDAPTHDASAGASLFF